MGNSVIIQQSQLQKKSPIKRGLKASEKLFMRENGKDFSCLNSQQENSKYTKVSKIRKNSEQSQFSTCESNATQCIKMGQTILSESSFDQSRDEAFDLSCSKGEFLPKYKTNERYFIMRREMVRRHIRLNQIKVDAPFKIYPAPILKINQNIFRVARLERFEEIAQRKVEKFLGSLKSYRSMKQSYQFSDALNDSLNQRM